MENKNAPLVSHFPCFKSSREWTAGMAMPDTQCSAFTVSDSRFCFKSKTTSEAEYAAESSRAFEPSPMSSWAADHPSFSSSSSSSSGRAGRGGSTSNTTASNTAAANDIDGLETELNFLMDFDFDDDDDDGLDDGEEGSPLSSSAAAVVAVSRPVPLTFRPDLDEAFQRQQSQARRSERHTAWVSTQKANPLHSKVSEWAKPQQALVLCQLVTEALRYQRRLKSQREAAASVAALRKQEEEHEMSTLTSPLLVPPVVAAQNPALGPTPSKAASTMDLACGMTVSSLQCDLRVLVRENDLGGVGRYESLRKQLTAIGMWI